MLGDRSNISRDNLIQVQIQKLLYENKKISTRRHREKTTEGKRESYVNCTTSACKK